MKNIPRVSQKADAMSLSADGTVFVFFGVDSPLPVHCFTRSSVSGVKWWFHLSSMAMNRRRNSLYCSKTSPSTRLKHPHDAVFVPLWPNAAPILRTSFSCPNCQSIYNVQHILKCLPELLSRALLVDGHPIPFCGFSSPFLSWSSHLVDHCDVCHGSSYDFV